MTMVADTDLTSLLNNLKVEDQWLLPPRPWESIHSESGHSSSSTWQSSPSRRLYDTSYVSEASLVRLAMNALQGLEQSLVTIDKLCEIFRSDPTDRTFHRIPSLWNQSVSTLALEKILRSLGSLGFEVFLLNRFVNYFKNLNWDEALRSNEQAQSEPEGNKSFTDAERSEYPPYSLVNQAFAVAVGNVLQGYVAALDTLSKSVGLRRLSHTSTSQIGCLSSVGHSEVTLLEVYLHTKGLRSQIEVLGSICNVHNLALCFSLSPLEDLYAQTDFSNFPRGANLLTYLYTQLKVADPVHCALLKILFFRSCEPYFEFIRSWIFKAKIIDPFNEFVVVKSDSLNLYSLYSSGILIDFPSATISGQDEDSVPCFLREFLIPLFRSGQQLQVLMKSLELSDDVGNWNRTYEDFLPYWGEKSSNHFCHASPLAFSKEGIDKLVLARSNYYKIMTGKLEKRLPIIEFKYRQVIPPSTLPNFESIGGHLKESFGTNVRSVSPSAKNRHENLPLGTVDSDASSMTEEFFNVGDPLDSSECSYIDSSEEEEDDESEKLIEFPCDTSDLEKKYLSALGFNSYALPDTSLKMSSQSANSSIMGSGSCEISEKPDINFSCIMEAQYPNGSVDTRWLPNAIAKNPFCNGRGNMDEILLNTTLDFGDLIPTCSELEKEVANRHQHPGGDTSSGLWDIKHPPKYLCANPILGRGNHAERCFTEYIPYFDFRSVNDPFTQWMGKSGSFNRSDHFSVSAISAAPVRNDDNKGYGCDLIAIDKKNAYNKDAPFGLKTDHEEQVLLPDVSGGSCWEFLLDGFGDTADTNPEDHMTSVAAVIEIPLDFVLEKCLLEEIQFQYIYVSKLTIKLLEEGFCLQEHLLALRRYHLMESADWADLFIMSLLRHKSYATEADKRISEIQGLLELSVKRSSCEKDHNKDRLFVYLKEQGTTSLPTGICAFNVLGLGYRVEWPVSIVLTSSALKIYAEIFSFLLQVKLALSSLTEVWCLFKEFIHFTNRNCYSDLNKSEACHFSIIVKLRHQIFHFVTTLQQYVQSQLSHVSWCRFVQSLKHKVKDMMDLDFVHMDYLNDSLCICFLSKDMEQIAKIIQNILQCALDFRSAVVPSLSAGLDGHILNISQVLTIKETFDQNLRQLYLCHLKSPKNMDFGLPQFWEYLNYNEHYSEVFRKETEHYTFF